MNPARRLLVSLVLSVLALGLLASQALAAPKAYVLNYGTNSVAAIDTQTNQFVGPEIPVGASPYSIAITPNGRTAYVGNDSSESLNVVDLQTGQAGPALELGANLYVVAISPDGKTAYMTTSAGKVLILDTQTNQVVGSIPVEGETASLWGVAFTPDGKTAYVLNEGADNIVTVDTQTRQIVGTPIPTGNEPISVAFTPDGKKAYVTNYESDDVSVIDVLSGQNVGTIPVGEEPWGIAITPDGKKAYVANYGADTVSVIDTQTNQIVGAPIAVGNESYEAAITPDGKTLYVTNYGSGSENVSVIDTQTDTVKTTIPDTGGEPWQVVVAPDQSPLPTFVTTQSKSGGSVNFYGAGSLDLDGTVTGFDWTFGDGATALNGGAAPKHRYAKGGTYTAGLTVTDNEGCSLSFVFTGRTAYCSGSFVASRAISVLSSNQFRFGRLKKNRHKGTAKLQVIVPAAGTLKLVSKKIRFVKKRAAKKGKVTLLIRAKPRPNKALKHSHRLKGRIRVTFEPTGGNPRSRGKSLTLVRHK